MPIWFDDYLQWWAIAKICGLFIGLAFSGGVLWRYGYFK